MHYNYIWIRMCIYVCKYVRSIVRYDANRQFATNKIINKAWKHKNGILL